MMRLKTAISTLWPVAVLWTVLIGVGFAFNADWPPRADLLPDFGLLCCIATFLVLLATLILRRMHGIDWLTIALATVFIAFSAVYFFSLGATLWPVWFTANRDWLLNLLRVVIAASMIWATALLLMTPDEGDHA